MSGVVEINVAAMGGTATAGRAMRGALLCARSARVLTEAYE